MSCPFQQYKNIFGEPNTNIHSNRFLNTAIIDYILTIMVACITTYYTDIPLVLSTIGWFVLSIVLHMLFGVETNTVKYLKLGCQ